MADVIAVLGGTGQQGRGLAQRFAAAGVQVVVGSRDPRRAGEAVASWRAAGPPIRVADHASAVAQADVAILAVPFASLEALLREMDRHLREGALVVDVSVPVTFVNGTMRMMDVPEGSATEYVRARLPSRARLAGAFKTIPATLLGDADRPLDCDEFVCGDSDASRAETSALVRLLPGARPVDVGPLSRARFVEHLTALAIAINRRHKIHDARFRVVGL